MKVVEVSESTHSVSQIMGACWKASEMAWVNDGKGALLVSQ